MPYSWGLGKQAYFSCDILSGNLAFTWHCCFSSVTHRSVTSTDLTLALAGCTKSGESLAIPEPQFLYLTKHPSESVWDSGCEFGILPCLREENCVLARMVPDLGNFLELEEAQSPACCKGPLSMSEGSWKLNEQASCGKSPCLRRRQRI